LSGWWYRKSHVINAASRAGTGYQVKIVAHKSIGTDSDKDVYLGTDTYVRDDFGDVRFTASDGTTLLPYWIESYTPGVEATFWVKVNDDLSSVNRTIYIYFGKSDATTTSSGADTFPDFFEHFPSTSIDPSKWTGDIESCSVLDSILTFGPPARYYTEDIIWSIAAFDPGKRLRLRIQHVNAETDSHTYSTDGFADDPEDNTIMIYTETEPNWWTIIRDAGTGTFSDTGVAISTDWMIHQILWKDFTYAKLNFNDGSFFEMSNHVPDGPIPISFWASGDEGYPVSIKVDWVFVSKYVDPEPAHGAWGSLETYPLMEPWSPIEEVATSITLSATEAYPTWIKPIDIIIIVKNEGEFNKTFRVKVYYEDQSSTTLIGGQGVTSLTGNESRILAFKWNLTGIEPCPFNYSSGRYLPYTIIVNISSPTLGEATWYAGNVTVRLPGDAKGPGTDKPDGWATGTDLAVLGRAWYKSYPEPGYDWRADFNGDGRCTGNDAGILGIYWGKKAQPA